MLQWTTPLMLFGLGLLAMPVIAHLLNRHSRKTFFIPTIRFLQQSAARQNRFLNLRRWLLLLLRLAAVAIIVSLFARPVWWQDAAPNAEKDSVAMVVVIDASLSTSRKVGNVTLFQKMKAAAIRSLNELEVGRDVASVIVANGQPRSLLKRLSLNKSELERQLEPVRWSYEQADLQLAIQLAAEQLSNHEGRKNIVVISDWQKTNWQQSSKIELPDGVQLNLIDLEIDAEENVALANATCRPSDPFDGQKIQLSVEVCNFSDQVKQAPIQLSAGSLKLGDQQIRLEPQQSTVVSFPVVFDTKTMGEFEFRTSSDILEVDDVAYSSTSVTKSTPIAVITDDPPLEAGTSTYFLERALLPFDSDADRFALKTFAVNELKKGSLDDQKIVVVGYVTRWNRAAAETLVDFVRNGGKLLYLCGEGDVANQIRQLDSIAREPFFPFLLSRLNRFERFEKTLYVSSGKWRSRWLRDFDFQSQLAFSEIRFQSVWGTKPPRQDADIILQYSDGRPTLGVRAFGTGTIVLANLSPSVSFSEFGKFGSFAALVQILIQGLVDNDDEAEQNLVGDSVFIRVPEKLDVDQLEWSVTGPSDSSVAAIMSDDVNRSVMIGQVTEPGLYKLSIGKEFTQSVAISTNREESDLSSMELDDIRASVSSFDTRTASGSGFAIDLFDKGSPLWGWFALIALGLLSIESMLLGWWKR